MHYYTVIFKLDNKAIVLTAVAYFLGCVIALLFLSKISNFIGRKLSTIIAVILCLSSILTLHLFITPTAYLIARFMQGIACGLASSAIMAYILDSVTEDRHYLANFFNVCGPALGFSVGAIFCTIIDILKLELINIELCLIWALLIFVIVISFYLKESIKTDFTHIYRAFKLNFVIGSKSHFIVFIAGCVFMVCWSVGGLFQSYISIILKRSFVEHLNLAGLFLMFYMLMQLVGGFICRKADLYKHYFLFALLHILWPYSAFL